MTILDSGEIPRLHDAIVDTDRLDARDLQPTRRMRPYLATAPISPLERYRTFGHAAVEVPATIAVADRPAWDVWAEVERPQVRPDDYRGTHRRPRPVWAWRALLVGLGSVATVAVELAGLAALAVWR